MVKLTEKFKYLNILTKKITNIIIDSSINAMVAIITIVCSNITQKDLKIKIKLLLLDILSTLVLFKAN